MNKKELLELAAKAMGYKFVDYHEPKQTTQGINYRPWAEVRKVKGADVTQWNPLEFNDDAFCLAIMLDIQCRRRKFASWSFNNATMREDYISASNREMVEDVPIIGDNVLKAARLAIVHVAARIGKGML